LRSMRVGIFAAGLMAMTPFFCRWASSGYVDVPGSFYFALTAVFAWYWSRDGGNRNAILTGIAAGLAMWTKNDALVLLVSLGIWIGLNLWTAKINGKQIALSAVAILLTAAPWYIRSVIVSHHIKPLGIWTWAVQHNFARLLIMTSTWKDFGLTGFLFTAAIILAAIQIVRTADFQSRTVWGMLFIMVIPFYGAWWWFANYDVRFLVMIVPLLAVMAGLMLDDLVIYLKNHASATWVTRANWIAICCVLVWAPLSIRKAVNYKGTILTRPFLSDAEKHRVVLGGMYDLATTMNHLPTGSRIIGVPSMALYHVDLTRFGKVSNEKVNVPPNEFLNRYDYAAYKFADGQRPGWSRQGQPLLQTPDGYLLFAVRQNGL
ncbi:MAG: hypothetical protein C5B54_00850, partial [Acidobacteria bacterium]